MSGVVAFIVLVLLVASLPVIGGIAFAPFLLGLFLLALVGVLGRLDDRTVRERKVVLDGESWRNGRRAR